MITLQNFEEHLSKHQLEKGLDYFESGNVTQLDEVTKGQWEATVEGPEIYTVDISLDKEVITETSCDCPHDVEFCKHVIATLYAILEIKEEEETNPSKENLKKSKTDTGSFFSLVKKVKNEELRKFAEEYARKDKEFRTQFLLRFADQLKGSGKEKYTTLIRSILHAAEDKHGIISFHHAKRMANRLMILLEKADEQLSKKNYLDPFDLAITLIRELHAPQIETDDSTEFIDDEPEPIDNCIGWSFSILESILKSDAGYDLKEEIFQTALKATKDLLYQNSGYSDYWLSVLLEGATDEQKQEQVLTLIDQQIQEVRNGGDSDWSKEFEEENLLRKKMKLLESMGRKEEARKVVEDNMRIKSFRRQLIHEAIAKKDFSTAKEWIKESKLIEEQQGKWQVNSEWDQLLLSIAQQEHDVRTIHHIGLRLFQDSHDVRYYIIIKQSYPADQWADEAEKIMDVIRKEESFGWSGIRVLASIFIEEQYWLRLLQLVQKNESLEFVDAYYEWLKDKYPEELVETYKEALRRYAEHNMGKSYYEYIAKTLRKIQSLPTGIDAAKSLTIEFKVKYRQRRNMIAALNRLVF